MQVLLDSNILLRSVELNHIQHKVTVEAVDLLRSRTMRGWLPRCCGTASTIS